MSQLVEKTVTVQFVNQPKEGRKTGNIKCADGQYIDVWPDQLSRFEKGKTYSIMVEPRDYNGKTYYTFKEMGAQAPAAGHNGAPTNGNGNGAEYEDRKSEAIFVTGVVQQAMATGKFGATDIGLLAKAATQAWRTRSGEPQY